MENLKISVVTPAFNSADTIRDTIESVLSQTYPDYEHIIIDGGSTDGTVEIIRSYEPRYGGRLRWVSEPDKGLYDAMNKGIAMATGDVVGVLNSDDFYSSPEIMTEVAKGIDGFDAVCGNLIFVSKKDKSKVCRVWKGSPYQPFSSGWHPAHPTFYTHRNLFNGKPAFNTAFKIASDFEMMLRLIEGRNLKVNYVDRCLVCMRLGGESTRSLSNIIKGNREVIKAFKINGMRVPSPLFFIIRRIKPKFVDLLKHIFHTL